MAHVTTHSEKSDRFAPPEEYDGYELHDPENNRIGKVRGVFVNEEHEPEYIRVAMGLFGWRSVLIPVQFAAVDEEKKTIVLE